MPDLIYLGDICADCGNHDELFRWSHALDFTGERWLCEACYDGALCWVGHIEDDVLIGSLEEDPWPLEDEGRAR